MYNSLRFLGRLIAMALLCASSNVYAQQRHALLIGIGSYPEDSGWNVIHGDNDVIIIERFLLSQGFLESNITMLTNTNATKTGILCALNELNKNVNKGDVVYIHFSGHGQQVTDINGDEKDGLDEAWVPYDAKKRYQEGVYEGQNHILDDELNACLNGLRAVIGPKGKIVVIADACHSGSGSRGTSEEGECIRGTGETFIIPQNRPNVIRKESPVSWLFVGACKSYQTNYEYRTKDGDFLGSLSYVVSICDKDLGQTNYKDVIEVWKNELEKITRYPQTLDDEGRPCKISKEMF